MGIQALILAAGRGTRLGPNSTGIPKPLLEVGRRPLIDHMLQTLADAGVGPVGMVVGYCADEIREVVGIRAEYIQNPRWASTNSIYSFALARHWIRGPVMILNCDLLLHPQIVDRLLTSGEDCLAYDSSSGDAREQMSVQLCDGILADMSKELSRPDADGENVGVLYLSEETARAVLDEADRLVAAGREKEWVGSAVREVCGSRPIRGVDIRGLPWAEIDFANDLERARKEVWPAIRERSPMKRIVGRAGGWILATGFVVLLSLMIMSAWFSPSPVEWNTVDLQGGEVIRISKGEQSQRWWPVGADGEPLFVDVVGPATIRIESRLVLHEPVGDTTPYVIEVRLDGERIDWYKLDTRPSKSATYLGRAVGKRNRIEFEAPQGRHRVSVALIAANDHRCLVRLRQAETDDE